MLSLFLVWAWPLQALAWGDEGHKVIGIIAEHFLEPTVRRKVDALLTADTDTLILLKRPTVRSLLLTTTSQTSNSHSDQSSRLTRAAFLFAQHSPG
jgi:hypothetical protein